MSASHKTWKRAANEAERRERRRASRRKWKQGHKQEIQAGLRLKRRTDPVYLEKERSRRRKSDRKRLLTTVYGITTRQYEAMLVDQDGRCGLCRRRPKASLCVDHCHAPKQVRKLLCRSCNSMLGFAGDDPDVLEVAAAYLLDSARRVLLSTCKGECDATKGVAPGIRCTPTTPARGPHHSAKKRYQKLYGISLADYDRMFAQQGGRCRICKRTSDRPLFVDHCHVTKKVRGLLCNNCNCLIGFSGDDPSLLMAGASYLHFFRVLRWSVDTNLRGAGPMTGSFALGTGEGAHYRTAWGEA